MQEQALRQQQDLLQEWQQEQPAECAAEQDSVQQHDLLMGQRQTLDLVQQQMVQSQQDSLVQQPPRMGGLPTVQELQMELSLQQRAREELEDMLLRYERQLKAESEARCTAEQKAQAAAAAADEARQQLASSGRQAKQRTATLAAGEEAVRQERAALESMRVDFEGQLQSARAEVAKAQAAMKSTEEHVRATAAAEKAALVSEYEAHVATLAAELERLRAELTHRTASMTAEMNRWKHQAALTAAAVVEAKNEVMERQRELHSTNAKMDNLIERLYGHREANIVLSGAIAAAAEHQQAATNSFLQQQAAMAAYASLHNTASMHPMQQILNLGQTAQMSQLALPSPEAADAQHSLNHATGTAAARCSAINSKAAGYSSTAKGSGSRASNALVPTAVQQKKASTAAAQQHAGMMSGAGALQQQLPNPSWHHTQLSSDVQGTHSLGSLSKIPQPFLAAALGDAGLSSSGQACGWLPHVHAGGTTARKAASSSHRASTQPQPPQQHGGHGAKGDGGSGSSKSPKAVGSYAVLHQQQQPGPGTAASSYHAKADSGAYAQTGSKYAESAARYVQSHQQKSIPLL